MTKTTQRVIASYVTDMLALEVHIEQALQTQIQDFAEEYPEVARELAAIRHRVEGHIRTLKGLSDATREGPMQGVAEVFKRAGSIVAGLGAAAVDLVRHEKLPKNLRDDYTAFSLASIGYVMLLTTSEALEDSRVAAVAERHLRDYAAVVMTLHNIIPAAVIEFLRDDGVPARQGALPEIADRLRNVWRSQQGNAPDVETANAGPAHA